MTPQQRQTLVLLANPPPLPLAEVKLLDGYGGANGAFVPGLIARGLNRPGFLGGCLSWVRRPRLGRRRWHDSALRPRREGRCRSERAGGGGCTSRPIPGGRTRPPRKSATARGGG